MRTPTCPYHREVLLDPSGTYRIARGQGIPARWFVLPPAMEHYYALRHPAYRPLPPWKPGEQGQDEPMEVLYPAPGETLLIPVELDGSRGKMVVEVAHRDPKATVFWDLDGQFIGTTTGDHRMALSPPDGPHRLTLTDNAGHRLQRNFTIVSGAAKATSTHAS
jgi:penicillin-binding protein 1C